MDGRLFRRGSLEYLEDRDRHLSARYESDFSFGFIGCGMMGQEHIRNALLLGRARIGGLYDPAMKSVMAATDYVERHQAEAPNIYQSLEEACHDPHTDALIIATPNYTHLEVLRVAAESDKAIFLEKPIATTVSDAFEVCRIAKQHPRPVRFGLQYRFKAIYAEAMHEVFERQSVGRVHSINMLEHRFPFLDKVNQWNKFNEYTGGTLVEKCCHYFDLMNLFAAGTPDRVYAVGNQAVNFHNFSRDNKQADGIDQAQVTISYDSGVIAGFSLCMFAPGSREELSICGDVGRLYASEQASLEGDHTSLLEIWRGENGASRTITPEYPAFIARAGHHGSTFFEHAAFTDDLVRGTNSGPGEASGFWSVAVGVAAQESIEKGRAVEMEEVLPATFSHDAIDNLTPGSD